MWYEEVGEVGWSQVIERFVGGEEHFEVDSLFDRQPVEVMKDRCDVFSGAGTGEQAGTGILDILKFFEVIGGDAI